MDSESPSVIKISFSVMHYRLSSQRVFYRLTINQDYLGGVIVLHLISVFSLCEVSKRWTLKQCLFPPLLLDRGMHVMPRSYIRIPTLAQLDDTGLFPSAFGTEPEVRGAETVEMLEGSAMKEEMRGSGLMGTGGASEESLRKDRRSKRSHGKRQQRKQ